GRRWGSGRWAPARWVSVVLQHAGVPAAKLWREPAILRPVGPDGSEPVGKCHAGAQAELAQGVADVLVDGVGRQEQLVGDLLVGAAQCRQLGDLLLPRGQPVAV